MIRPQIGTQIPAKHCPSRYMLNGDAHAVRASFKPRHEVKKAGVAFAAKPPLKLLDRKRELLANIGKGTGEGKFFHATKGISSGGRVNPLAKYFLNMDKPQNCPMDDNWPQRVIFRKRLKEYLASSGKTQSDFCQEWGFSLPHLRNTIYTPGKTFSIDALQAAAGIFGCPITDFIDDPGAAHAGQNLSNMSDQSRFFTTLIVKDMAAEDLTDEDRRYLYEDHLRALERLRQLRTRSSGSAGPHSSGAQGPENRNLTRPPISRVPRPKR